MPGKTFAEFFKEAKPLFVKRTLRNAEPFIAWAKSQGFKTTLPATRLHVTIAFSKQSFEWPDRSTVDTITAEGGPRSVEALGDEGAVVLRFESSELQERWQELIDAGASWDWPGYKPHVTISWDASDVDLTAVEPYTGSLEFGPEVFDEIDEDWKDKLTEKAQTFNERIGKVGARHTRGEFRMLQDIHDHAVKLGAKCPEAEVGKFDEPAGGTALSLSAEVFKVEADEQRLVWGWASVTMLADSELVDLHNDVIDSDTMLKAATEFMENTRAAKMMHDGDVVGMVVHSLPLTKELSTSFGLGTDREGWIIGVKVYSDEVWKRVKDGTLAAFSIGGVAAREVIE